MTAADRKIETVQGPSDQGWLRHRGPESNETQNQTGGNCRGFALQGLEQRLLRLCVHGLRFIGLGLK